MGRGQSKQTEEDGLADTVKPRLMALGVDCSRVLVIDESERELTLSDRRLAQAIQETGAGLLVLDPIQAYLGEGRQLVSEINCRPESVYDDFLRTKLLCHKEGGSGLHPR